jgi:phage shock protein A
MNKQDKLIKKMNDEINSLIEKNSSYEGKISNQGEMMKEMVETIQDLKKKVKQLTKLPTFEETVV